MDLAVLQRLVPKVERASGKIEGSVHVTGKAKAPAIAGELHAAGEELAVHGLPSALTDIRLDVRASATELAASGKAKFAGGTVSLVASVPVRGFEVGALDSHITVRGRTRGAGRRRRGDVRRRPRGGLRREVAGPRGRRRCRA